MLRGIRSRITALATVVVVAVLALASVALLASQRRVLTENLDESLTSHAHELLDTATAGGSIDSALSPPRDDDAIAQVATVDGRVIATTANFAGQEALPPPEGDAPLIRTSRLLPGEPEYRVVSSRGRGFIVHTAFPTDDIDESIAALRTRLSVAIPSIALLLAALVWWLVGRTLRPVESIRREVADISGGSLHRRVPEPGSGDEIEELARTMNAMLDRVEEASRRQQRFVADASHELRSPLTRIRTELEVDVMHTDEADLVATHRSVLQETEHLQRLVEDLLTIARHDAGPTSEGPRRAIDLDDLVLREADRIRPTTSVRIDVSGISAAQVDGRVEELDRLVRNLLDNAVRHACTTVWLCVVGMASRATLTVTNDGPGISAEHQERVFERFTRLDEARTTSGGGSGLGLAIARDITERHGGGLRIDSEHSPGVRFVVDLPLATEPD